MSPELRTEKYILLSMDGKLLGPALSRIRSGRNAGREGFPPGKRQGEAGSPPQFTLWSILGNSGGCSRPSWIWEVSVTPKSIRCRPRSIVRCCPGGVFRVLGDSALPESPRPVGDGAFFHPHRPPEMALPLELPQDLPSAYLCRQRRSLPAVPPAPAPPVPEQLR